VRLSLPHLLLVVGLAEVPAPPVRARESGRPSSDLVYERIVDGNQDLYVFPAKGGLERRLTRHPATDALPRWGPDGRSVLFASNRSGSWQLWEVGSEGGEASRTRSNAHHEMQADISPDGRRIAVVSNAGGPEALWIVERATGEARELVRHGRKTAFGNPHWSRDGTRIVFSSTGRGRGHQVYLVDVAAGKETLVSRPGDGGCEPRFSPDGRKVLCVKRGGHAERSRLVEHDLESGRERVLVAWPALNYDPVYSPDGKEIAFASDITGEWAIYRQRLADARAWRVTFGPGPARYPDYRPGLEGR
jgi:Tol biopolymer transport system component